MRYLMLLTGLDEPVNTSPVDFWVANAFLTSRMDFCLKIRFCKMHTKSDYTGAHP